MKVTNGNLGASVQMKKAMNRLVEIAPAQSPMVSCFVDLDAPRQTTVEELEQQAKGLSRHLSGEQKEAFEKAFASICDHLANSVSETARGVAIYAREGEPSFLLPLEFGVPIQTRLIADDLPHVYPLIETKDRCERFVIVMVSETYARILETTMGAVTREIMEERPALRKRIGREWTREHYQNHKRDREERFLNTKVDIVTELMRLRGHNHLVVAGSPKMVNRFTRALPKKLQSQVVSTLTTNPNIGMEPIVHEAIEAFEEKEGHDSHHRAQALHEALLSGGLAVAGDQNSRSALQQGYADMLVIDQELPDQTLREELVRLAVRNAIPVETVKDSEKLQQLGGVGCLLRYRPSELAMKEYQKLAS